MTLRFHINFSARALKSLAKIPHKSQQKILRIIDNLGIDPFQGKKLKGEYEGMYSARAWPYRIIYLINRKEITIFVVDIGHRQGIYSP